jgi:hypothetical protein
MCLINRARESDGAAQAFLLEEGLGLLHARELAENRRWYRV